MQQVMSKQRTPFTESLAWWLAALAEAYAIKLTPERAKIYRQAVEGELTVEQLNHACKLSLRNCKYFPTVSEILGAVKSETKDQGKLEADQAWDSLQRHLAKYGADRMPLYASGEVIHPPALDPATEYAARQCGGLGYLGRVSEEQYHWARKDFVAHYARYQETGGLQQIPGRAEARQLIQQYAPQLVGQPKWKRREPEAKTEPVEVVQA